MGLSTDLKRPINLIFISIGLISLLVSIIIYNASQQSRVPAYLIEDKRGQVFDSEISTPAIKVLDKENKTIKENIYLATITFWNAGDLPIEPEHIRKPVTIKISPVDRVVDFTILEQSEPDISKIQLKMIENLEKEKSTWELELSWLHLDPNHGARIQIMYVGEKNANITFGGNILGVNKFKNAQPTGIIKMLRAIFPAIIGAFFGYFITLFTNKIKTKNHRSIIIFFLVLAIFTAIMYSIYLFALKGLTPPL